MLHKYLLQLGTTAALPSGHGPSCLRSPLTSLRPRRLGVSGKALLRHAQHVSRTLGVLAAMQLRFGPALPRESARGSLSPEVNVGLFLSTRLRRSCEIIGFLKRLQRVPVRVSAASPTPEPESRWGPKLSSPSQSALLDVRPPPPRSLTPGTRRLRS